MIALRSPRRHTAIPAWPAGHTLQLKLATSRRNVASSCGGDIEQATDVGYLFVRKVYDDVVAEGFEGGGEFPLVERFGAVADG